MDTVATIAETREKVRAARRAGKTIGFVPTMGFLHEGHLSLVRESKKRSDFQVMSIFVNRIQFNDANDFSAYPRAMERDCDMARDAGVDLVFAPDENEMYRAPVTYVDMDGLTGHLCGAHRPGHFRGVFTVVSKLFNIVQPDVSVFGQKDIQQAVSIEKMTADLDFPVEIVIAPTVREPDGLAMSSRNARLSADARARSLAIVKSLRRAEEMLRAGERSAAAVTAGMRDVLGAGSPESVDYVSLVRYADLLPAERVDQKSVIALAAFFGGVRLIDNMIVETGGGVRCVY